MIIDIIKKGLEGRNIGIPMDDSISHISRYVRGIKKKQLIVILGPSKSGKSTFCDFAYVLSLCKSYIKNEIVDKRLNSIVYYSFEIDRISKELEFIAHFIAIEKPGKNYVKLPKGVTVNNQDMLEITSDYINSEIMSDQDTVIYCDKNVIKFIEEVIYPKYIIPIFGEYDNNNKKIKDGIIDFIENRTNPTGMFNFLKKKAQKEGKFLFEYYTNSEGEKKKKIIGYKPKDPDRLTLVIIDHNRKWTQERGYNEKQLADKSLDYQVILRNLLGYTFISIVHSNRSLADMDRRKNPEYLYPTPDDSKGSGNYEEDCDLFWTTFNPNDDKYNIKRHFGLKIKDESGEVIYPKLRTLHLVAARKIPFPVHFRLEMNGGTKMYKKLKE